MQTLILMTEFYKLKSRFEAKYVPDPNSGCWLWIGAVDSSGYGNFRYKDRYLGAHKVSYLIHKGEVGKGYLVLHTCDVRCCVNPNHLKLGTHADNMEDRNIKGRQAHLRGTKNGNSKLNEEDVITIFTKYDGKEHTIYTLGREYNVHPSTIHLILKGRNWSHITKHELQRAMKEGKYL